MRKSLRTLRLNKIMKLLTYKTQTSESRLGFVHNNQVVDMEDFGEMNKIWNNWIDAENKPVRACVEAPMAHPVGDPIMLQEPEFGESEHQWHK